MAGMMSTSLFEWEDMVLLVMGDNRPYVPDRGEEAAADRGVAEGRGGHIGLRGTTDHDTTDLTGDQNL